MAPAPVFTPPNPPRLLCAARSLAFMPFAPLVPALPLSGAPMTEQLRQRRRGESPPACPRNQPRYQPLRPPAAPSPDPSHKLPNHVAVPQSHPGPHRTQRPRDRRFKLVATLAPDGEQGKKSWFAFLKGPRGPLIMVTAHLLTATIFLTLSEGWAMLDALYFAVVIATTVGYGDITPKNPSTKLFVSIYAIVSVVLIAGMLQLLVENIAVAHRNIASRAQQVLLSGEEIRVADEAAENSTSDDLIASTKIAARRAGVRLKATILMVIIAGISGVLIYGRFLQKSYIDLVYFLCVSMTTVGLGDIHPVTPLGKAYATIWLVLTSLGFANLLSQYGNLRLKERERDVAKEMLSGDISEKMFREIDTDGDNSLSEAEFLGYMLCKLGKTESNEVRSVLDRFRHLDKNRTGYITREEVAMKSKKNA